MSSPGKRKMDMPEFPLTGDDLVGTDPTFTTPNLIKEKANFISEMDVNNLKNIPSSCFYCDNKRWIKTCYLNQHLSYILSNEKE